ncbi:hypothetical protein [Acinetobacter indicus]|uniref:hypothetical protein n=1 Tax=Acinetobacter indicus TaxID=756892 RepID=UPI0032B53103
MIPNNKFSSIPILHDFLIGNRDTLLIDYEYGSESLENPDSNFSTLWTCFYEDNLIKITNGFSIVPLLEVPNVTELSFAFDLNMRPLIAYSTLTEHNLWWYDTEASSQVTSNFDSSYSNMHLSLDDNRSELSASADVILAYIRNNKLYMRIQRERFQIEHELANAKCLIQIGMMKNYRFGFAYYNW